MLKSMITIREVLDNGAVRWPDKIAVDIAGQRLTYAELRDECRGLAHGLSQLGLAKGDRICALLDNSLDFALLALSAPLVGAIVVPLNTALKGEFLRHQIADSGARLIILDAAYRDRLDDIRSELFELQLEIIRGASGSAMDGSKSIDFSVLRSGNTTPLRQEVGAKDLAFLLYTSGTTGPSKGCMISHNYICNMGRKAASHTGVTEEDTYWTPCPLFHIGALGGNLIGSLQLGATAAIAEKFSVSQFWPEIERSGATVVMLLSMMLHLIADASDTEASERCHGQLHTVMGLPFPQFVQDKWKQRFGVQWAGAVGYGLTEAVSITIRSLREPAPAEASGRVFEDYDVRIFDDDGNECAPGVAGEIVVRPRRPEIMFQGYWRKPEATLASFSDLWFHTGDIARIDEQGFLYFVDRKKDCLRRGGENISSFELEAALRRHPFVSDVAVYGVPSEHSEEEVKADIVLEQGASLLERDLHAWSVENLPRFAVPRYIEFCDDFPRNGVGRVLKFKLREKGYKSPPGMRTPRKLINHWEKSNVQPEGVLQSSS